ncbi:MAG: hypothetical protein KatS3mg082_1478 [Nitrospiraceae bacterium]|nr:MAG: hypothetical protein KatS3mg082_1478 [Nitrospiraceae bacterium]
MVPVTVSFAVGVVFVEDELLLAARLCHHPQTLLHDVLAHPFERDQFPGVGTFGCGILGMRAVHVEAAPVGKHLVQLAVVLRAGPLAFALDLKAPNVEQRILVLIIPKPLAAREARDNADQME